MDASEVAMHRAARYSVNWGFARVFGRAPRVAEAQVCQGVGWLETKYGTAWHQPPDKSPGYKSYNMGAIQCCSPSFGNGTYSCPGMSFLYVDTHPLPDGASRPYRVCFRSYANAQDGFYDLARTVYLVFGREKVLRAAQSGSVWNCSAALRDTGYYEGFGKTREERIANHAKALGSAITRQCAALGEQPMEPFSLDEEAEQAMLFDRVRMMVSLAMEYDYDEAGAAIQRSLLEQDEIDASQPLPKPPGLIGKIKGLWHGGS